MIFSRFDHIERKSRAHELIVLHDKRLGGITDPEELAERAWHIAGQELEIERAEHIAERARADRIDRRLDALADQARQASRVVTAVGHESDEDIPDDLFEDSPFEKRGKP